jgi:hypothetical protein
MLTCQRHLCYSCVYKYSKNDTNREKCDLLYSFFCIFGDILKG